MLNRMHAGVRVLLSLGGALALLLVLGSCTKTLSSAPQRLGPPVLVVQPDAPRLWVLTRQQESRVRSVGSSNRSIGTVVIETLFHFDLQAHDTATTERVWKTRLFTLNGKDGGSSAQARILGQHGDAVWLFLRDQPVAVSARDGSRLADGERIEAQTPALQELLPKELKFYAFDDGLVITAADSRRYKVRWPDASAEPYQPASEKLFERIQWMSSTWNGGYPTNDFLVRQATRGGRWLGLYTEKEAADAGNDEFGRKLADPATVLREGPGVRRSFWTARIGSTREFSEGSHDRLFDVTRVPDAPDFLDAGLLVRQGSKQPLELAEPSGVLVLHRTRIDQQGRVALTRLDDKMHETWTAKLPFLELQNRFELPDHLLMVGVVPVTEKGVSGSQECIASLDLRNGRTQAWNVTLERSIPAAVASER